jgi:hypothetical protein
MSGTIGEKAGDTNANVSWNKNLIKNSKMLQAFGGDDQSIDFSVDADNELTRTRRRGGQLGLAIADQVLAAKIATTQDTMRFKLSADQKSSKRP